MQLCEASAHPDVHAAAHLRLAALLLEDAAMLLEDSGIASGTLSILQRSSRPPDAAVRTYKPVTPIKPDTDCEDAGHEIGDDDGEQSVLRGGSAGNADGGTSAPTMLEAHYREAAEHLAAGLHALEIYAGGSCLQIWTALKEKLSQVLPPFDSLFSFCTRAQRITGSCPARMTMICRAMIR